MTDTSNSDLTAQRYLPHRAHELPGHAPADACSPEIAAKNADSVISKLMIEQKREKSRMHLPELAPEAEAETPKAKPVTHPRKTDAAIKAVVAVEKSPKAKARKVRSFKFNPLNMVKSKLKALIKPEQLMAKVRGYRPTRKHVFFASIALIVFLRPWLIPAILFVTFWVVLIAYLTLGPDRVAELVSNGWQRLRARRPELAETIRQKADRMALRVDKLLDRLPTKWTENLYLPDFSQPVEKPDEFEARPDPFDRLATKTQQN